MSQYCTSLYSHLQSFHILFFFVRQKSKLATTTWSSCLTENTYWNMNKNNFQQKPQTCLNPNSAWAFNLKTISWVTSCHVFSSPGLRPCELMSWVSVCPSVSFSHLNLLLWNRWTEISQTCQKCSLDGPLPDLCFWCWFEIQHGCQGP